MTTRINSPELQAHQAHVNGNWRPAECGICADILARARDNHNSHAGSPTPSEHRIEVRPGWWVAPHDDLECIEAYRRYAEGMSAS